MALRAFTVYPARAALAAIAWSRSSITNSRVRAVPRTRGAACPTSAARARAAIRARSSASRPAWAERSVGSDVATRPSVDGSSRRMTRIARRAKLGRRVASTGDRETRRDKEAKCKSTVCHLLLDSFESPATVASPKLSFRLDAGPPIVSDLTGAPGEFVYRSIRSSDVAPSVAETEARRNANLLTGRCAAAHRIRCTAIRW
jgi:hypothetical protein